LGVFREKKNMKTFILFLLCGGALACEITVKNVGQVNVKLIKNINNFSLQTMLHV
jgi:hypothetical protein